MNLTTMFINSTTINGTNDGIMDDDGHQEHMTTFERYFYLLNGLVGTFLNIAVLLIAFLHVDTHDKPRQIIVVNMTMADLLTCTIYMLTRSYLTSFAPLLCYPYYVSIVSCQLCSCFNLLWINVDKLLFIKRPLHYYTLVSRNRVLLLMTLTWASLLGLVCVLYSFMVAKHPCDEVELPARIYLLICVLYIFTISASFAVSAVIFCIAHNSRRAGSSKEAKRLFKRLFFVFSSTLWTFATCLPYRLLYLGILLSGTQSPSPFVRSCTDIAYMLLVVGIVINPLITIITQRLYRQWISAYSWQFLRLLGVVPKAAQHQSPASGAFMDFNSGTAAKRRSMGGNEERPLAVKGRIRGGRLESVVELDEEEVGRRKEIGGK